MQVSLRRANVIQVAVNEALKGLEFKTDVSINEFQDPATEIEASSAIFSTNIGRRGNLLAALYEIRKDVSTANTEAGIDARLADVARFDKDIIFFGGYNKSAILTETKVLNGKLDKIRNSENDKYGFQQNEVTTSILTQVDIAQFRGIVALAKKAKQKVQDELLELNVRTQIELSAKTIATLTAENIL